MNGPAEVIPLPLPGRDETLIIDIDGFEGPLDLLLMLARTQKVDLREISILALAEQYLAFVNEAKELRIELAADYLVMAAWIAWLKSRLLLPPDPAEDGPSADEMAAHLAWQLERLEAMRDAAARLMTRAVLGQDRFGRGLPEQADSRRIVQHEATLYDLMQAYARLRTRDEFRPLVFDRRDIMTLEEALDHLRACLGGAPGWADLHDWLPEGWGASVPRRRSGTATTFAASLQLVKEGRAELRQEDAFAPISIRRRRE